jgi:hypothetical protein
MSSLAFSLRLDGALSVEGNEFQTNLVPYTTNHFILDEDRRVHHCEGHQVIVFAACNKQGIGLIHPPFFSSFCVMILYLFIHVVLATPTPL